MTATKRVAYIFQEPTGKWHVCDDAADMLDARGQGYGSIREAIAWLRRLSEQGTSNYTHYRHSNGKARKL